MNPVQAEPAGLADQATGAPAAIELRHLRHLRYFVAVADVGSFTLAAERMHVAQPTQSQQIRRLEEIVGASLPQRRRDGVQLTAAGHQTRQRCSPPRTPSAWSGSGWIATR